MALTEIFPLVDIHFIIYLFIYFWTFILDLSKAHGTEGVQSNSAVAYFCFSNLFYLYVISKVPVNFS